MHTPGQEDADGDGIGDACDFGDADETPPVITAHVSPEANGAGWHRGAVTVRWDVSDDESGVASSTGCGETVLDAETAETTLVCQATNGAGASASVSVTVRIDRTPPKIARSRAPEANEHGWNNVPVTVAFACDDSLSGVETCSPAATLAVEGAGQSAAGEAVDRAGNRAPLVVGDVNIDTTAPTLDFGAPSPAANAHGWNNGDVAFGFVPGDALSGVAATEPAASPLRLTAEGAAVSGEVRVRDRAGNEAVFASPPVRIDRTPPEVTTSQAPEANPSGWNNTDVVVRALGADALSGIDACDAITLGGEGAGLVATVGCADRAGNAAATTRTVNIDRTPPRFAACTSNPRELWPPNHRLVDVTTFVTLEDGLSGAHEVRLAAATSDEPDNGLGDGDTTNDIQGWDVGTRDTNGKLRAERSGLGDGRVYTLAYAGMDAAGNTAACAALVTVPHDRSDAAKPGARAGSRR